MYQNETTLTPLFRYVIGCIENDKSINLEQSCSEIKSFCRETISEDESIMDQTIQLLEMKSGERHQMYSFWKKGCDVIESGSCDKCIVCNKCQSYFWYELGELFFDEANKIKKAGYYLPVRRIPNQIEKHLVPSQKASDLYYYNNRQRKSKIIDGLIVLKGMSSSTPSLMNSIYDTNQFSGGGFFLRYNGIGVVIDPGYHFLDNLHHYGLSVLDVNAVVITHEHIDHNNDMRLLDDMHYAVYSIDGQQKKIHWYLDEISYEVAKIYQKNETGFDERANVLHCVSPDAGGVKSESIVTDSIKLGEGFQLKCFPTKHIETKGDSRGETFKGHTFGCEFKFDDGASQRCLVYTSDTRYFPELIDSIDMPDILIANISGIYEDDFMLVKPKERHLGYYGCYHLLHDIWDCFSRLPDVVMLSEFWNGQTDIRYDVSSVLEKQMRQKCENNTLRVIPAEVGMIFQLTDGAVRCSQCGRFTKDFLIRKPSGYKEKIRALCNLCVY